MSSYGTKAFSLFDLCRDVLRCVATVGIFAFAGLSAANATTLYDNLSATTGDVATASGDTWLAQALTTDSSSYVLGSVTLLLSAEATPTLSIYSNNGGEPGSLLSTLSLSSSYSSSVSSVTFSTSGLALSANTTYWVVLSDSASADWAWTTSNSGSGSAFSTTSAESDDAGSTWFTADAYPYQMSVSTVAAVPLPASLPLMLSAVIGMTVVGRRKNA